MLDSNPRPVAVPCHRVVCSGGGIGGYAFGIKKKIVLLEKEGVKIKEEKIDLDKYLFRV
ncbi:MAG: MGMT family protein [Candidatus Aenigmatarchaeota archaeon]